jgi:predicted XRE-type DNA-binding protein
MRTACFSNEFHTWYIKTQNGIGYDPNATTRGRENSTGENQISDNGKAIEYEIGSGNVYQDLGFSNPKKWSTKARIASKIFDMIEDLKLTQKETAKIFEIAPGRQSDLRRGPFNKFSLETLFSFLQAFDQEAEIVFRPKTTGKRKPEMETRISI